MALAAAVAALANYGLTLLPNLPLSQWPGLLPLSLVFLLIQVSAEELVFRGYLQPLTRGLVVQLVRIPACHAGGREFESRPDRQQKIKSLVSQ